MMSKIFINFFLISSVLCFNHLFAQQKVKDFRSAGQKVALVGAFTEFVETSIKDKTLEQARRVINKYSRTYGASSIASFKLGRNPNDQYFKPVEGELSKEQKAFLDQMAKDNAVDIVVLASMREVGEQYEMQLQLYDIRIETLSAIEQSTFSYNASNRALEVIVFRLMNYLDRDGYVHDVPQDFLETPQSLQSIEQQKSLEQTGDDQFSIDPEDLSGGYLASGGAVAGEKTPFWEKWWFWTLIGGGLVTAGGLTYFFLVVNQSPTKADVGFDLPVQ